MLLRASPDKRLADAVLAYLKSGRELVKAQVRLEADE
jgi:hypothetical protein